ncbi:MAG: helix-turn-helix domain-containing protein [Clostridiales bacterium]|nr:helix-turn-helix domain-containing protein [Clostridiales bacterium]
MSRLGDLLHLERTRRGMSAKEVSKLAGVSEKYLLEVESGSRIIQDDQARRILKKMGAQQAPEAAFTLDDIAATVDLQAAVSPQRLEKAKKAEPKEAEKGDGSIWLDALSGILRSVPVYNAVMAQVGSRMLPVLQGKIEGAPADKVFYFVSPDQRMRGFRVHQGDLVLVVPAQAAEDGKMMLLDTKLGKQLYMVKILPRYQLLLQTFDRQNESEIVPMSDAVVVGRCVRLEAEL